MRVLLRWQPLLGRLLGLLLLTAAALKIHGLGTDPIARMGIFSTAEFQLAIIVFELALAVWLLSGKQPLGSWVVALVTFTVFAAVNLYHGWVGQASCGCFGRLSPFISPWQMLGLDLFILAVLVLGRPRLKPLGANMYRALVGSVVPLAIVVGVVLLLWAGLFGFLHLGFGSLEAGLAYFRGERVSPQPWLIDVGRGQAGEKRQVTVTLTNWTDEPIQVLGGTSD
jgi:hypothetical protein